MEKLKSLNKTKIGKGGLTIQKKKIVTFFTVALLMIAAFYAGYTISSPSNTFTISSGVYPGAPSYTISTDGEYYYAKNAYGAIDYSGTDVASVIQAALDALSPTAGGKILFNEGIYTKTSVNNVTKPNVHIQGMGRGTTTIQGNSAGFDVYGEATGFQISDLTLDGAKPNNIYDENKFGIRFNHGTTATIRFIQIRNIAVTHYVGDGIVFEGNETHYMDSVYLDNVDIDTCNGDGIKIVGCNFSDFKFVGMYIINNLVYQFYSQGICTSEILGGSFILPGGSTYAALQFDATEPYGFGVKVIGASIYQNDGSQGIGIGSNLGFDYLIVEGCFFNSLTYGLNPDGNATNWKVTNNVFGTVTHPIGSNMHSTSGHIIKFNTGYVTEKSGTFSSVSNGTYIAHGLAGTPTIVTITLSVQGYAWLGTTNSTCFRIYASVATISGSWYAEYKP